MKVLVVIVIILAIVALAQIMKVYNLSAKLRGKSEAEVSDDETKFNAGMLILFMIVFLASSIYLMIEFPSKVTGPSASEHGQDIDWLYNVNWVILLVVFFITQPLLFIFAAKYRKREGVKATFFAHSNKLELIWTVVPAVVLAFIIIFGLTIWNDITEKKDDVKRIEVYAYQFGWFARYAGEDNVLGNADFKVLDPATNPLGIVTKDVLLTRKSDWEKRIEDLKHELSTNDFLPDAVVAQKEADISRLERQVKRLLPLIEAQTVQADSAAYNDVIVKEMCLIKGQDYEFKFRSRDVIHSAFFPHFRAQMNCVPGMVTRFTFKPIYTTEEMREMPDIKAKYERINKRKAEKGEDPIDFDYILLCNKICGASHYNMQMKITVVEDKAAFMRWYEDKKATKSFAALMGLTDENKSTETTETVIEGADQEIMPETDTVTTEVAEVTEH